jgi:methylglyoxal reductase
LLTRRTLARGLAVHPIGIGCWAIGGPDTNLGLPMGWSTADDTASLSGLETAYHLGANLLTPPMSTATAALNGSWATS